MALVLAKSFTFTLTTSMPRSSEAFNSKVFSAPMLDRIIHGQLPTREWSYPRLLDRKKQQMGHIFGFYKSLNLFYNIFLPFNVIKRNR